MGFAPEQSPGKKRNPQEQREEQEIARELIKGGAAMLYGIFHVMRHGPNTGFRWLDTIGMPKGDKQRHDEIRDKGKLQVFVERAKTAYQKINEAEEAVLQGRTWDEVLRKEGNDHKKENRHN